MSTRQLAVRPLFPAVALTLGLIGPAAADSAWNPNSGTSFNGTLPNFSQGTVGSPGGDNLPNFSWLCPGGANGTSPSQQWANAINSVRRSGGQETNTASQASACPLTATPTWASPPAGTPMPPAVGQTFQATPVPVSSASNNGGAGWLQQTLPPVSPPVGGQPVSPPVPVLSTSPEGGNDLNITGSVNLTGTGDLGNNGAGVSGTPGDAVTGQTNTGNLTINGQYAWSGNGLDGNVGPVTVVGTGGNTMVVDNPDQPNQPPPVTAPPVSPVSLPPAPPVPPMPPAPPLPPIPPASPIGTAPPPGTDTCGGVGESSWGCTSSPVPPWGGGGTGSSWGDTGTTVGSWGGGPPDSSWGGTPAPVATWGGGSPPSGWGVGVSAPPVGSWGGDGTMSDWG